MDISTLNEYAAEIKKNTTKTYEITPRDLISAFFWSRRTANCQSRVGKFLAEHQLEVDPSYLDTWIDSPITLKHKPHATTKTTECIKKIAILEAANRPPVTVTNDSRIIEAITIMIHNDYSQLPITSGGSTVIGYISWETIGVANAKKTQSEMVKDYANHNIKIVGPETSLLEAIEHIHTAGFVVIQGSDRKVRGIVTTADISSQFLKMTEPFLLLEQIESNIRKLLDKKFLVEDLTALCASDSSKTVTSIDDLNFGHYIRLIENEKNWTKLGLHLDRVTIVKNLDSVRKIRNDIMHFDPDGISKEDLEELRRMSRLLLTLVS